MKVTKAKYIERTIFPHSHGGSYRCSDFLPTYRAILSAFYLKNSSSFRVGGTFTQ